MVSPIPQPPTQSNPELVSQTPVQTALPTANNPIEPNQTSPAVIVILLIVFAPLAWYFMWKEKRYHKWFAFLLSIYPILSIIILSLMAILVIPKLSLLYEDLSVKPQDPWRPIAIALIINFIQLTYGIFFYFKARSPKPTPKNFLIIAIIFLAISMLIQGFSIASVFISAILPIYNLTSVIN